MAKLSVGLTGLAGYEVEVLAYIPPSLIIRLDRLVLIGLKLPINEIKNISSLYSFVSYSRIKL
ncbi:hypothetical protein ES703_122565 [subsurface metagenome]